VTRVRGLQYNNWFV